MKKIIHTKNAPAAVGPYSQAVDVNGTLYIAGQVPVDPSKGVIVEGGITEQTRQVMMNIGAILEEAGYSYKDVVKSTCALCLVSCVLCLLSCAFYPSLTCYYHENPSCVHISGLVIQTT